MKTTRRHLTRPLMCVTLIASALLLTSCASPAPQVRVISADRMIRTLPSGNYEVTPAWLKDRYEYERALKERMEKCK